MFKVHPEIKKAREQQLSDIHNGKTSFFDGDQKPNGKFFQLTDDCIVDVSQIKDQLYRGLEYLLKDHQIDEEQAANLLPRYKAYIDVIMEGQKVVE